jgi:1-acyl-sn-glycerol-3-phosphate acyltransferase
VSGGPAPIRLSYARGLVRTSILIASLLEVQARFFCIFLACGGRVSRQQRADWLHASCARILQRLAFPLRVVGRPPSLGGGHGPAGLLVSNHLSYLDILIYGASCRISFVSKSDVRRWPLFGALASAGNTVFVDRSTGAQSAEATRQIEQRLREGIPVLFFPEGTSSDGNAVLPFRSALFEPAIRAGAAVTAAAIRYYSSEASEAEISYWGTMVFLPHLFRTLCLKDLQTEIRFGTPQDFADRKSAARHAWQEVCALREAVWAEQRQDEVPVEDWRRLRWDAVPGLLDGKAGGRNA